MTRRATGVVLILLLWFVAPALAGGPTLTLFEARGLNLLTASPAGGGAPVSLIFPVSGVFPDKFTRPIGEALFPAAVPENGERLTAFLEALGQRQTLGDKTAEEFDPLAVRQVRDVADRIGIEETIGAVRLVNLNHAFRDDKDGKTILEFMRNASLEWQGKVTSEPAKVLECREIFERKLTSFVEHAEPMVLEGRLRGVFDPLGCPALLAMPSALPVDGSPEKVDNDGDGLPDVEELELRGKFPKLDPKNPDSDGDGLTDGEEMALRRQGIYVNPTMADTDSDGLDDKREMGAMFEGRRFNPANPNTFSKLIKDGEVYRQQIKKAGGFGLGKTLLGIALVLLSLAFALIFYFWGKDKARRKTREKIKLAPLPEYMREAGATTAESPAIAEPETANGGDFNGFAGVTLEEDDEDLTMAERVELGKMRTEIENLQKRLEDVGGTVERIAQRLDQMSRYFAVHNLEALEKRLSELETREPVATAPAAAAAPAGLDKEALKKFNQMELLIGQSLSEMGRLLNDYEQRIDRLEMRSGR
ncbi:MAG: hypothetical protein GX444_12305 [Myxococcales bacterium]|nr:hypothetical protein [Myxococcales bacterium]